MIRIISTLVLILSIILFPPAALALISNNAVPGDATYPIKRFLEDRIYDVASLNSSTKAWFAAARSDKRFDEIKILVNKGKSATVTLNELVAQTNTTVSDISKINNKKERGELLSQVEKSIEKYDQSLKQLGELADKTAKQNEPLPVQTPAPIPTAPVTGGTTVRPTPVPTQTTTTPPVSSSTADHDALESQKAEFERIRRELEEIRKKAEEERKRIEEQRKLDEDTARALEKQRKEEEERRKKEDREKAAQKATVATTTGGSQAGGVQASTTQNPTTSTNTTTTTAGGIGITSLPNARVVDTSGLDDGDQIESPTPTPQATPAESVAQASPAPPACVKPGVPGGLGYNNNTKTASWNATSNTTHYNVRLVIPGGDQHNFDNVTNTWYTFPESLVSAPGNYSWWVDAANDCAAEGMGSTFQVI